MRWTKLLFTFCLQLVVLSSFSQTIKLKWTGVNGPKTAKILDSDASHVNQLYVGLRIPTLAFSSSAVLGLGLEANYLISDQIFLQGSFVRPIFKGTDSGAGSYNKSARDRGIEIRLYNRTQIGATFYLAKIGQIQECQYRPGVKEPAGKGKRL